MMPRKRTDAERRIRQCERLGRLLRVLRCITGPGRWDVDALANELQCSPRTVYRLLETLTYAGIPWFFDEKLKAYKVRPGFKFPALDPGGPRSEPLNARQVSQLRTRAKRVVADGEQFLQSLRQFCEAAESIGDAEKLN